MDENAVGGNSDNGLRDGDEEKIEKLEGDLKEMIEEEKPKSEDPTSKILTGASTESNVVNTGSTENNVDIGGNASFVSVTSGDAKADVGGFPTDVGGKQNVQDPIPSMAEGGGKSEDKKMKLLLKVAIIIFVLSLLVLSVYIVGARKGGGDKKVESTPLPVMTDTPQPVITAPPESATPSASTAPNVSLEESTQSSFLQTATPSSSPEL